MDGTLKEEPGLKAAHPKRTSILSQGEGDRLDRWVEFLSAIVLSLATVLTAWCGYQATRWSGEQAQAYSEASAARVQSAQLDKLAAQKAEEANQANEQSDHYVLLTVLFATVLFFAGISGKFQWQMIDLAMLVLSAAVLIFGLVILAFSPMR